MKYLPKTLIAQPAQPLSRRQLRRKLAEAHNASRVLRALRVGEKFHDPRCPCRLCAQYREWAAPRETPLETPAP